MAISSRLYATHPEIFRPDGSLAALPGGLTAGNRETILSSMDPLADQLARKGLLDGGGASSNAGGMIILISSQVKTTPQRGKGHALSFKPVLLKVYSAASRLSLQKGGISIVWEKQT